MIFSVIFVSAQINPALEMTIGDSNPTTTITNVVSNTTIRLRNNTDNPTGNTFATYSNPSPLNVTYALTNQQYTQSNFSGYNGAVFIGYTNEPILTLMNAFGNTASNTPFTSNGVSTGTGIDIATNRAVNFLANVQPLSAAARATNQRWQMADLTITFSRPVNNPYLQINALGGLSTVAYSGEFDYVSSNVPVTFSKVSGTASLNVTNTQILNSAITPNADDANAARGTVRVTGVGITTLTLRMYIRGAAANTGTNWHGGTNTAGEGFMIGASVAESNLIVSQTVNNPNATVGGNVIFTVTASNTGASNNTGVSVTDLLPSGLTYVSATPSVGTYNPVTGIWTIGNLNTGVTATLTLNTTLNANGVFVNNSSISGDLSDPDTSNNAASITVTSNDLDGDGILNINDLDNDNDGILDSAECNSVEKVLSGSFNDLVPDATNISAVPGWALSGGTVLTNSFTSIIFNLDNTTQTLSQNVSNIRWPIGATPIINMRAQFRDFTGATSASTMQVQYGGVTYATLTTSDGSGNGTIVASNGASINTTVFNTVASGIVTNLSITLPSTVSGSGSLTLVYNANNTSDDDIVLDNISIVACRDFDSDNLPDFLDLDSDGDGCFDALEGDENVTLAQLNPNGSIISGAVSAQGIPVLVNSGGAADIGGDLGQGLGASGDPADTNSCIDTDGDGIANDRDLDDDNDGILDAAEGLCATTSVATDNFDTPLQTTINGNNIVGTTFSGWTALNNAQLNVIRVDGTGYASGPDKAQSGSQYIDIANGNTYLYKDVVITTPVVVNASAWLSNRDNHIIEYPAAGWSGQIEIINTATNAVVLGNTLSFTSSVNSDLWFQTRISNVSLPAGNYRIRIFVDNLGQVDTISYCFSTDTDGDGIPDYLDLDSDNDGCADAIEGSETVRFNQVHSLTLPVGNANYAYRGQIKMIYDGVTTGTPAQIISTSSAAIGVPQLVNNATNNLNANTNPSNLAGAIDNTDGSADIGQGVGTSKISATKDIECDRCLRPATTTGTTLPTNHGITALSRAGTDNGNWPIKINGAYTALDAKGKGFVINRLPFTGSPSVPTGIAAANFVVGMMVYDTTNNCLKIYDGTGWYCYTKQTCDNVNQ
jgi:uncharacterized repeat protein (TIGR01451 family)